VESPENRPAPLAALLDDVTPADVHYRRNHYPFPAIDPDAWRLPVTGAVITELSLSLDDLRAMTPATHRVLLECAGHRRNELSPPVSGLQWQLGALSQANWSGPPLAAVLALAGLAPDAVEVVLHGADSGPFAELPGTHSFSRAVPVAKALHPDTLLALDMNGEALPKAHGAPVRAIVPGWYAMDSVKWVTGIEVVTTPFRGVYQELDYRWQPAGETGIGERIDEMPPHALFVSVAGGDTLPAGLNEITGIAWGAAGIGVVDVRVGSGRWETAKLVPGRGPYERALWRSTVELPASTQVELAVRATDTRGRTQPDAPTWNRRGYVNNSVHRVTVTVLPTVA
jgi:DMSO/TMAO reductase YedYZ molybdopterin-dependent catalytic subunit